MTGSLDPGHFQGTEAAGASIDASPTATQNGNGEANGKAAFDRPYVSVVLPDARRGRERRAARGAAGPVLPDLPVEIIFVDDSDDDTPDAIRRIDSTRPVYLIHRPAEERGAAWEAPSSRASGWRARRSCA